MDQYNLVLLFSVLQDSKNRPPHTNSTTDNKYIVNVSNQLMLSGLTRAWILSGSSHMRWWQCVKSRQCKRASTAQRIPARGQVTKGWLLSWANRSYPCAIPLGPGHKDKEFSEGLTLPTFTTPDEWLIHSVLSCPLVVILLLALLFLP